MVEHARQLDHPAELHLSPAAPDMWRLERAFEGGGRRRQRLQLLAEP